MPVDPPRPKTPPLNALRAFEAALRHGGFVGAAGELSVTPGAVAQQVKTLEAWAGAPLFERKPQGIALTGVGAAVAEDFEAAFDALAEASRRLRRLAAPREVRIAALPAIAQLWLAPRLPEIRAAMPDVIVSITALEDPPNFARALYDIALFYAPAPGAAETSLLGPDVIFPVCAPDLAANLEEETLDDVPLLTDAAWAADWETWRGRPAAGPAFSLYALAVEEAVQGAGVLIGHEHLVSRHLESGALVAPFSRRVALDRSLTLSHKAEGAALKLARMLASEG